MIKRRQVPVIGNGAGIWSFIHVQDAASAAVAALDRGTGVYNIVDDEPAPVSEWLPVLAAAVGAKKPFRVPVWLGRLAAGETAVVDDDAGPRLVQRQGQARTALGAWRGRLAGRLRPRPARGRRAGPGVSS